MTGTDAQIEAVDELREHFKLSTEELIQFRDDLRREMDIGLKSEDSNMAMLPSWIFKHPTGQETGEYLGLEISGKDFFMSILCVKQTDICVTFDRFQYPYLSREFAWSRSY